MKCPFCGFDDSKVIDSRPLDEKIRRRRECIGCHARFTTYEIIEQPMLMVEKRSGSFEPFDRTKLIKGIVYAVKKRPVCQETVYNIADYVENKFANDLRTSVRSDEIGELVLERLRDVDSVAYIRFASVYRDFTDVESFIGAINALEKKERSSDNKKGGSE